jgi:hypothetical protein
MAFQDCAGGVAPLQVGQFESTAALMDQWLTWCWIMGGGASQYESYDLAFYFAAHHTKMDCWEKRKKKGYLFMSGDETCYPELKADWIHEFIGDKVAADRPLSKVIDEAKKTFHPFYLIPDRERANQVQSFWHEHLGAQAIALETPEDTCPVAAGAVALSEGAVPNLATLDQRLRGAGLTAERSARVAKTLAPYATSIGKA